MQTQTPLRSSFRDFLTIIFKRKYLIVLFFIVSVCTIVGITYSMEPTYRTSAQILVKIGSRNNFTLAGPNEDRLSTAARISQINTEIEFLKSRFLAEKVLLHLGPDNIYPEEKSSAVESHWLKNASFVQSAIAGFKQKLFQDSDIEIIKEENPSASREEQPQDSVIEKQVLRLLKHLSIKGTPNTNIIKINFQHTDPDIAATVVNTYMDTYLDERLQFHRNPQSRTFVQDQSLEIKNRLEEAEFKLEQFKSENNITDLEQQQRILLDQISTLRVALNNTLSEEIETQSRVVLLKKQLSQTPETIPQEEQTDQNEVLLSRLEGKLVELQIEEKELLSRYTPQSRMVNNVRERITIVENKIDEQEHKLFQRSRVGVNATYQRLEEELFRNEAELEALAVKKDMMTKQLAEFQSEKETLNRMETKLSGLQRSVDLYRGNYKLYLAKLEASRIEDAMDSEKINEMISMDRALPPLKPISPKYKLNIFLSILIGALGGLLIAIIGDFMDDSIETPEDVEKTLQLPVLTSIPDTESRKRLDYRKLDTKQSNLRIQIP